MEVESNEEIIIEENYSHPFGVQPFGQLYFDENFEKAKRCREGMGNFIMLNDSAVLDILAWLTPTELLKCSTLSKAFYVFTNEEELWRSLCIEEFGGDFEFHNTWRKTYQFQYTKNKRQKNRGEGNGGGGDEEDEEIRRWVDESAAPRRIEGFYSDEMFQPFRCASVNMKKWEGEENIDRRSNLTVEEFIEKYEKPNRPVIITDVVEKWTAYAKGEWTKEALIRKYGEKYYKMGNIAMTLRNYFRYCSEVKEETPLYLFDNEYDTKSPEMLKEYEVPKYFEKDFFAYVEESDPQMRPSYRWILFGPPRSGSTFHKDPNYTSAWNGLISGRKKWILFPPDVVPPGVIPSDDEADVTTPISVIEWFLNFYPAVKDSPVKPIECVLKSGELLFIPHMWWHTALNLEESIAVTQNYVNEQNLLNVLDFLKKNQKFVLHDTLLNSVNTHHPSLLASLNQEKENSKSSWEKLTSNSTSFSFSFNFDD